MPGSIDIAVYVLVYLLYSIDRFNCSFITPEPSISNLSQWASVQVDQVCGDSCYSGFSNDSCIQSGVCLAHDICNGRTGLPALEYPLSTWSMANNSDGCLVTNTSSPKSTSTVFVPEGNHQMLFINGSAASLSSCYSHRNGSVDSIFTLVFWLMADCDNCSVLELPQNGKQSVHIRVIREQICVNTECQGYPNITTEWVMISVRVVTKQMAIFVNDEPFQVQNSTHINVDNTDIFIGSEEIPAIGDIFRLYYVRYYKDALTLRELNVIRNGTKDPGIQYEDCQCPVDYLEEIGGNNCTDKESFYPRYNTTMLFNDASVTLDGNINTSWASSDQGAIMLTLNFVVSFQVESVIVKFGSVLPDQVSYLIFSGSQQRSSGDFLCTESICRTNITRLDNKSTVTDMADLMADKIQIQLHRKIPEENLNFVVSEIDVTGRCDCSGNAENCTVNYENQTYSCLCKQETQSLGQHCQSCLPSFFRSPGQFDCHNKCDCNSDGVANVSNQCEQNGGICKCKKNVEGQKCDTCKPFSFNFGGSLSNGCDDCNCNQNATLSCSNATGSCTCKANTQLQTCDKCVPYNYGFNNSEGCQPCNCTVAGTVGQEMVCDDVSGQCHCKPNVQGLMCDTCKPGYYGMETANQRGCKPCECHPVGSEVDECDAVTGQCLCRGSMITNKSCAPVLKSVDPTYGPRVGGTMVTISGNLLGNTTHNLAVFLNDVPQDLISVSDTLVVFRTVAYNISSQLTPQLKLSWKEDSSPFNTNTTFTYMANPVLDMSKAQNVSTFISGGCQVRIYGTNLQSVKYPKLEVALTSNPLNRTAMNCRHTIDYVMCSTPHLKGLYTSDSNQFQMTVAFDGVNSGIDKIEVSPNPHLDTIGTIRFQYPFENTITLSGKNLRTACQEREFIVQIGVINCAINHITDTEIECAPAVSPPGEYNNLPIQVIIGNFQVTVGTLHYLELHETTGFIIIISCIAAVIAIAIVVTIICCCWRRRKDKTASSLNSSDNKQLVSEEANTLNAYSELPKHREEPPIMANGHNEAVQRETVFQEPKKGIVNTEAEDSILRDEFLPKVDAGLRDEVINCYVGTGHFVLGRHCSIKGKQAQLIDGSLQKSGSSVIRLTIKSVIHPITGSELPVWGNLALSECLRLRQYKHTHVLNILGIGISKQEFHILYPRVSQYVLKTLISDASKEFNARQLIGFGQQVAEGIAFLASKNITHKDVAARNCMVDEQSSVKLCDSSFSWDFFEKEYVYDEQRERYLPIRWMAPESLTDGYYDMRTDVWSFAVLMWELLTRGCLPYHEATNSEEISNFITQGFVLGKPDVLSDSMYELLCHCWSHENEHRPSVAVVSKSLEEILNMEDDGVYANAAEVAVHRIKNDGKVLLLRQSPKRRSNSTFTTPRLSRV